MPGTVKCLDISLVKFHNCTITLVLYTHGKIVFKNKREGRKEERELSLRGEIASPRLIRSSRGKM